MTRPASIAVLGEALIDVFPNTRVIGGAPFNVARNLALLGGQALMLTRVGEDAAGNDIAAEFERIGMSLAGLQRDPMRATGLVQVRMQGHSHVFEIGAGAAWDALDRGQTLATLENESPALLYFGTLAQRSSISRETIRAVLSQCTAPRFLDLNLRDGPDNRALAEASLDLADIVKVNDDELRQLLRWFAEPGLSEREAIETLVRRHALRRLVVTRGELGWTCFDTRQGWLEGGSPPVQVCDSVGAGDAFAAVLLLGELRGWALPLSLQRAAEFAAQVCTVRGAIDPTLQLYAQTRAAWNL